MSYVNQDLLKMQKRRHSIKRVTPEEAIEAANKVVDKANDQIAVYLEVARTYEQENHQLRADNEQLRAMVAELEAEVTRLRKKATRKSGRNKGAEWEGEER